MESMCLGEPRLSYLRNITVAPAAEMTLKLSGFKKSNLDALF